MSRFVEMKKEGWWSGDLHIHRPPQDIELLMRAEDLHIGAGHHLVEQPECLGRTSRCPRSRWCKFDGNRFYHLLAGEDEREGGALLVLQPRPSRWRSPAAAREYPSPVKFLDEARADAGRRTIDIEKPFWWDVPVWIAHGQGRFDRPGEQPHASRRHVRRRSLGQAARRGAVSRSARQRPLVAGDLLPAPELRPADSAVGRQRVGRAAQSGRLQPRLRPLRQRADLGQVVGESAAGARRGHQRPAAAAAGLWPRRPAGRGAARPRVSGREGADRRSRHRPEPGGPLARQGRVPGGRARTARWCTKCGSTTGKNAKGHLPPVKFARERLDARAGGDEQPEDLSLCQHRAVLRRNRRQADESARNRPSSSWTGSSSGPAASSSTTPDQQQEVLEFHRQAPATYWQKKVDEANAE